MASRRLFRRGTLTTLASGLVTVQSSCAYSQSGGGFFVGIVWGALVGLTCYIAFEAWFNWIPRRFELVPVDPVPTPNVTPKDLLRWLCYFLGCITFLFFMILGASLARFIAHRF